MSRAWGFSCGYIVSIMAAGVSEVSLPLWFLSTYLLVVAAAPALLWADRRIGGFRLLAILDRAMKGEVRPRVALARRAALNAFDSARTYTGHGPMIEALKRAAARGVVCRVMVDDVGSRDRKSVV